MSSPRHLHHRQGRGRLHFPEGKDEGFVFVGKGTYPPTQEGKVGFRWGIYQGSKPGSSIRQDYILFVTGVKLTRSGEGEK